MRLLDIEKIDANYEKIQQITQYRNKFFRKIIFDVNNHRHLFEEFMKNFQSMQEIMNIKSAQQEATSAQDLQKYIHNLREALSYVLNRVSKNISFPDHTGIIYLHRLIEPDMHQRFPNQYRRSDVKFGSHWSVEHEKTYSTMNNLIYKVGQIENPIIRAIFVHHEVVRIHPFVDGNGRLARLLMNWVLMFERFPPVFIKTNKSRDKYIRDLDKSFTHLEKFPEKPNEATNKFFNDEIDRLYRNMGDLYRSVF